MLKYLAVMLDDTSVSFCHYSVPERPKRLIALNDLKAGILFAMKENLNIQFIYPNEALPDAWKETIESIDHAKITSTKAIEAIHANIVVSENTEDLLLREWKEEQIPVLRIGKGRLPELVPFFERMKNRFARLNVIITDIESFSRPDFALYEEILAKLSEIVEKEYITGNTLQLNLLTDRIMLSSMNNCNAGDETLTLAPNGKFYVCPAFYYHDPADDCGDSVNGVAIKNSQLYRFDHAPICRHCDAYQCHRCVWLNRRTTLEVNTPSHEQCVVAHIERSASRNLRKRLSNTGKLVAEVTIPELNYSDPFDKRRNW